MQRQVRVILVTVALALVGIVSPAHAQYMFINSPSTSPNPYTYGQGVDVPFSVNFDPTSGWEYAVAVDVEVEGSDGYYGHSQDAVGGTVFCLLQLPRRIAGTHTSGVSYTIRAFVIYYDPEWGQWWWHGPTMAVTWANYQTPQTPSGESTDSGGGRPPKRPFIGGIRRCTAELGGRSVTEQGGGGNDTCWFPGSILPKSESVAGTNWPVNGDNTWGPDYVGWLYEWVLIYRSWGRAPCDTTLTQHMVINCPGCSSDPYGYVTNICARASPRRPYGVSVPASMRNAFGPEMSDQTVDPLEAYT